VNRVTDLALSLAASGLKVFPCADTKAPLCPSGFKEATSDPSAVRDLFGLNPGRLIGVRTGEASGIDVLDIDVKHEEATTWWQENEYRLPKSRTHRTRSGGFHILFQHSPGQRCTVGKIALGVDTRADDGYVIWWPAAGYPVLNDAAPAPWPEWLLKETQPPAAPNLRKNLVIPDDRSLAALVRTVVNAPVGKRNVMLYWVACRLAERIYANLLNLETALAILEEAGRRSGLSVLEARRTALSGLRSQGER
jgi:hypothetical protein